MAPQSADAAPSVSKRTRRYVFGFLPVAAMVAVAALVGAGAALLVARATGWGTETVVKQFLTTGGAVSDHPMDIKALLAAALPAVVSVQSTTAQSNPFLDPSGGTRVTAQGTGVVIGSTGEIITNAHLVRGWSAEHRL